MEPLTLPKLQLERTDGPRGRTYLTPEGDNYESVTTFLGRTGTHNSEVLTEWRKAVGEVEADRASRRGAQRGTNLHHCIESHLCGNSVDFGKNILLKEQFRLFKPVLAKVSNIRGIEYPLYSNLLQMAGTVDLIADYDGVLSIIDWKSSNHPKKYEDIEDYWLQTTIYSLCAEERYHIKIPQLVIAISVDNMPPQVFVGNRIDWIPTLVKRIKANASL